MRAALLALMASCASARLSPVPVPPTEPVCAADVRPLAPENACDRWTATGYLCARCAGGGGCVSVPDGVYCVRSSCAECGAAP